MNPQIRNSLRTGVIFAVVHIFLVLIGFNTLMGTLLSKISGTPLVGSLPAPHFMVIYTLLLAVWAGAAAAKQSQTRSVTRWLTLGATAGFASGLIVFFFSLGLGWFLINKVDFRLYLAVLSFDFIRVTLFDLAPLAGALASAGIYLGGAALGGLIYGVFNLEGSQNTFRWVGAGLQKLKATLSRTLH